MRPTGRAFALALAASLSQPACTAVGYLIGALVDKGKPSVAKPVPRGDLETLDAGDPIEVSLWDGRLLTGRYRGLEWAKPTNTPDGTMLPARASSRTPSCRRWAPARGW